MHKVNFTSYYRVFKNDTDVTKISVNDFKPVKQRRSVRRSFNGHPVDVLCSIPKNPYSLPADKDMFYGYVSRSRAMEKAKAGAQSYISHMIKEIECGLAKLKEYRAAHYEDLNITLLDANIRRLEKEMNIK